MTAALTHVQRNQTEWNTSVITKGDLKVGMTPVSSVHVLKVYFTDGYWLSLCARSPRLRCPYHYQKHGTRCMDAE